MRTTLTLEDDVAARVQRLLEARDTTLKALVNEALRRGLDVLERPAEPPAPYSMSTRHLGESRFAGVESVAELLALGEGEAFR